MGAPHCQKRTGGPEDGSERKGARNDRARNERREAENWEQGWKTGRRRNLYGPRQRRPAHREAEQRAPRLSVEPLQEEPSNNKYGRPAQQVFIEQAKRISGRRHLRHDIRKEPPEGDEPPAEVHRGQGDEDCRQEALAERP